MTVRELLARTDSRELAEWEAYCGLHPFGDEIDNWRAGTIAAVVANCHSKRPRFKPSDFMPRLKQRRTKRTREEIGRNLIAWAACLGAKIPPEATNGDDRKS
jgi:hypothetical protein